MDVLVLAGTTLGRRLVERLVDDGVDVLTSIAGRTRSPRPLPGPTRTGGFGGVEGLERFLVTEQVRLVVDATHAFASTMHDHAAAACGSLGVPLLRLCHPSWRPAPGASAWTWVADHDEAARVVASTTGPVVLTVGRQPAAHYLPIGPREVVLRCVDPPDEVLPEGWTVRCERGPFDLDHERRALAGARVLVSKDSGGADLDPKLVVARERGIDVVMVSRAPTPSWGDDVGTVEDALAWLADRQ